MQFGPFPALDFVLSCQLRSCLHFRLLVLPLILFNIFSFSALCLSPFSVHSTGVFFFNSVSQLWDPGFPPWHAVNPHSSSITSAMSPSLSPAPPPLLPLTARILQEGRLLPDYAKAPGGENSPGWALSLQSGFSARGLTEKVLDHKLDGDAAILLLRPSFDLDPDALAVMLVLTWTSIKNSGLSQAAWTTGPVAIQLWSVFLCLCLASLNCSIFFSAINWFDWEIVFLVFFMSVPL